MDFDGANLESLLLQEGIRKEVLRPSLREVNRRVPEATDKNTASSHVLSLFGSSFLHSFYELMRELEEDPNLTYLLSIFLSFFPFARCGFNEARRRKQKRIIA